MEQGLGKAESASKLLIKHEATQSLWTACSLGLGVGRLVWGGEEAQVQAQASILLFGATLIFCAGPHLPLS